MQILVYPVKRVEASKYANKIGENRLRKERQ